MVDFKKKLKIKTKEKLLHPCEIYEKLDRASDKGPLRPVQDIILRKWYDDFAEERDVILKLHTGQGKTLIGLLILQSKLNKDCGPVVYLCPDNYLVQQTCEQADSFGIKYVTMKDELPDEFISGKKILITTVSKMFNGETKFLLGTKSQKISTIVMDDAHACMGYIKKSYTIKIKNDKDIYYQILSLFEPELEKQGVGTYADIKNKEFGAFLSVPYWEWQEKYTDVARLLSKNKKINEIRFPWPIIKDILKECRCIISGTHIEIAPYSSPIEIFGSFNDADHRIFMSATVNNDSFFIKGLGLKPEVIQNPLIIEGEKWSGEKMILIPSLIDESMNRMEVVNLFAKPRKRSKFGIVAIIPNFNNRTDWEKYGSVVASKETLYSEIEKLKNKECDKTLVIVNRYDGVDLPDNSCRILVLDSMPFGITLEDRYFENCRSSSEIIYIKRAQTIEQGIGRGVRGEKDYCAIIITGNELVRALRSKDTKKYFSSQTKMQVDIGFELAEFIIEEIGMGKKPIDALKGLINQLLKRDEGWKEFYVESMNQIEDKSDTSNIINILDFERKAENLYKQNDIQGAMNTIQEIIDNFIIDNDEEKGWYLQEMARYSYPYSTIESNKYQIAAHKLNPYLFKPREGMIIKKISSISFKRIENIISWVKEFDSFEELFLEVLNITEKLRFGIDSDQFEKAFDDLGKILGFTCQRPDKEWNEGPDNLWKLNDNQYLLVECKNKVLLDRSEINKDETGQMNNACAWFSRNYGDVPVKRLMIIPTNRLNSAAGFNLEVEIMKARGLNKLVNKVNGFFREFKEFDFKNLSEQRIQKLIENYNLTVNDIMNGYSEKVKKVSK